jgi:hypothetical protein
MSDEETLKVVMLFSAAGPNGVSRSGDVLEIPKTVAEGLIRDGYAKPIGGATPEELQKQVDALKAEQDAAAAAGEREELENLTRTTDEAREAAVREQAERDTVEAAKRMAEADQHNTADHNSKAKVDAAVASEDKAIGQAAAEEVEANSTSVDPVEVTTDVSPETAAAKRRKS